MSLTLLSHPILVSLASHPQIHWILWNFPNPCTYILFYFLSPPLCAKASFRNYRFLVNPNASSHYHAQPPTNISQNYSLQQPSSNHYDSSFNQIYTQNYPSDQTNYQQTSSQQFTNVQYTNVQPQQFYQTTNHYVVNPSADSGVNNLNASYQQQDMNDLLAPGSQLPQNLFNIPQISQVSSKFHLNGKILFLNLFKSIII